MNLFGETRTLCPSFCGAKRDIKETVRKANTTGENPSSLSFCAKKGIGIFPGTFFLYNAKRAGRLELFVHLFAENSLPCKGRWVAVRQAGGIFSKNRFQKESASLFNPSVIFAIASLVKGGGLPLRQLGGIFSKNRFQKESASLFNPSVIFDDSSLYKGA